MYGRHGGDDRFNASGDADGDCQGVIDKEGGPGHQSRPASEVFVGHGVGAAARRVGPNELAVGDDDDAEQGHNRRRDGQAVAERTRPHDDEDEDDLLRGVGRGGKGIGGKDCERDFLRKPLAFEPGAGHGGADDPVFDVAQAAEPASPPFGVLCRLEVAALGLHDFGVRQLNPVARDAATFVLAWREVWP